MSEKWRLNLNDAVKSLASAVGGAAIFAVLKLLEGTFGAPDLNLFAIDWAKLGADILNTAWVAGYYAFVGNLARYFAADKNGKALGVKVR